MPGALISFEDISVPPNFLDEYLMNIESDAGMEKVILGLLVLCVWLTVVVPQHQPPSKASGDFGSVFHTDGSLEDGLASTEQEVGY